MARKVISDAEIAAAALGAGFKGAAATKIVAIALAESSGNIYAHNAVPPDNSYGLTQVNMLGDMGPERRKKFGLKSNEELYDPATNMRVAYALSNGGKNFGAWSTYTTGAYFAYLSRASKATGSPASTVPGAGEPGIQQVGLLDAGSAIIDFFELLSDPRTWFRLGCIIGGGILVVVALAQISGTTGKIAKAADTITDVIPQTRVAKTAAKAKIASAKG